MDCRDMGQRARVERQLLGAIAVAVQRGNALIMLTGYSRVCGPRIGGERRGTGKRE